MCSLLARSAPLSDTTPHGHRLHDYGASHLRAVLVAVIVAGGLLASDSLDAQSQQQILDRAAAWLEGTTIGGRQAGPPGRVGQQRRDADDAADCSGRTRRELTDAEVDELKGFLAKSVDQGGDAIFGNLIQLVLEREGQGRVQADLVRSDDRQLQPVLDGRSRVGQPHVAHHRSARRAIPAADRRRRRRAAPPRPRARARAALRMVPKIDRCRSAAFPTARRGRSRITTATRRSSSRPTPSCCCRR